MCRYFWRNLAHIWQSYFKSATCASVKICIWVSPKLAKFLVFKITVFSEACFYIFPCACRVDISSPDEIGWRAKKRNQKKISHLKEKPFRIIMETCSYLCFTMLLWSGNLLSKFTLLMSSFRKVLPLWHGTS